jgi:hypothetical protein
MSDARLRELERAWRASGALEDEVALLQERWRAGTLPEARLRAAAALGHEAAIRLTGLRVDGSLEALWDALHACSGETAMRAALAYARALRRRLREAPHDASEPAPWCPQARAVSQCVDSATAWTLQPSAAALGALDADAERLEASWMPLILLATGELTEALRLFGAVARGLPRLAHGGRPSFLGPDSAPEVEAMRAAMRAEVVPWLLDPEDDALRDDLARRLESVSRIEMASPCDARWEDMTPIPDDPRARRCERCDLDVLDLKALTLEDAEAVVHARERGARLCVRLFRRKDGSVLLRDCPIGLDGGAPPEEDGDVWIG